MNRLKTEVYAADTTGMGRRREAAYGGVLRKSEQAPMPVRAASTWQMEGGVKSSDVGFRELVLECCGLRVDVKNFLAWADGEPLELRIMEFALLANLVQAPGELKTREELSGYLWEDAESHSTRTIDVHIQRIRAALAERSSRDYIRSVRGLGYRFAPPGSEED